MSARKADCCQHVRQREGDGVLIRLFDLDTGRGHCRARILHPPRPGRNGLGAVNPTSR